LAPGAASRGGQEFRYAESWMAQASSALCRCRWQRPGYEACRAQRGKAGLRRICCLIAARRQRVQRTLQAASSSAFDLLTANSGPRCARGGASCCHSMKKPSGLDSHEANSPPAGDRAGCCEVRRSPTAAWIQRGGPSQQEEPRSPWLGLQEKNGPAPHTHLFKLADGNGWATEDFFCQVTGESARAQKRQYAKTKVDLAWWRSVPVWPQSSACRRSCATSFWASAGHGPCLLIHRQGVPPSGRPGPRLASVLEQGLLAPPTVLHPGFRAGFARCGATCASFLAELSRGRFPPCKQWRVSKGC